MARDLDDIIASLPRARQKKIIERSAQKVEEMMAHAKTLTDVRNSFGKTQVEVGEVLGIKQNAVSQLEKRSDTYVSTLRKFLKSLGLYLELSVVSKSGERFDLPNLFLANWTGETTGEFVPGTAAAASRASAQPQRKLTSVSAVDNKATATVGKRATASSVKKKVTSAGKTGKSATSMHKA